MVACVTGDGLTGRLELSILDQFWRQLDSARVGGEERDLNFRESPMLICLARGTHTQHAPPRTRNPYIPARLRALLQFYAGVYPLA